MADNYLEKQMDQYLARKAAWEKERKYGKKKTTVSSTKKSEKKAEPNSSMEYSTKDKGLNDCAMK